MANHYDEFFEERERVERHSKLNYQEKRTKELELFIKREASYDYLLSDMKDLWVRINPPNGRNNESLIYDLLRINISLLEKLNKK